MTKFIFDGPTKVIEGNPAAVVSGVFQFTAQELYSEAIDWWLTGDNSKYPFPFITSGGDPLGGGVFSGVYVFMRNDLGWRGVPPDVGDIQVIIEGNFYPYDQNQAFFLPWPGVVTIIQSRVSQMTQAILTGSGVTSQDKLDIADTVWSHTTSVNLLDKTALALAILKNKTITNPTTGLMTVYSDDGTTPLLTAQLYEGITTSQPYRGQGAERREMLE